jgi:hypothetical protein
MATSPHAFSKLKLGFEKLRFEPARASLGMPSLFRGFVAWTISSRISSVFQVGQLSSMRSTARPLRTHSTFVLFSHHTTTFAPSPAFLHFSANIALGTTASPSAGPLSVYCDLIDAHPRPPALTSLQSTAPAFMVRACQALLVLESQ